MTDYLTTREAAALLGVPADTLQSWVRKGYLPRRVRDGRQWYDKGRIEAMASLIPEHVISTYDLAAMAGCHHNTVCKEAQRGCLKAVRLVPGPKMPYLIGYEDGVSWARMYRDDPHHLIHRASARRAAAAA